MHIYKQTLFFMVFNHKLRMLLLIQFNCLNSNLIGIKQKKRIKLIDKR